MVMPAMGLSASWWAGNRIREVYCLGSIPAKPDLPGQAARSDRDRAGGAVISGGLPKRIEAMSTWAVNLGLMERPASTRRC